MDQKKRLIYGLNDKPAFLISLFLALQHLILVIPGTIITPMIIVNALGLPGQEKEMIIFISVLISGISTFIQVKKLGKIGSGYMLFMGSSGAFISISIAAGFAGGFGLVASMTILSAPLEITLSYFMRYVRKIITPAIGGIAIILIAIGLIPIFMDMWTGYPGDVNYCSKANLITGFVTIIFTILFSLFGRDKIRLWSPLLGIFAGVICAYIVGIADFSPLHDHPWIGIPRGKMIIPDFNFKLEHLPIIISFLFATLASTIETVGDSITVQEASHENLKKVDYESVQGSLYADGFTSMLAGAMGSVANTTFSGNIGAISITGVASRKVGLIASTLLVILAFFPKLIYSVTYIPTPVMGASSLVLTGVLFASGIKLISTSNSDFKQGLIVGISLTVGIISTFKLFFPELISDSLKPFFENGIATGGITAVGLSLLSKLNFKRSIHVKLKYDLTELVILQNTLSSLRSDNDLNDQQYYELQLCCEEIFAFLSLENPQEKGMIDFRFHIEGEDILITVNDSSNVKDIDLIEPEEITSENQKELGLMLVNQIAENVEHIRIGKHNEISFVIKNRTGN
jgi:xanthine permease XanP